VGKSAGASTAPLRRPRGHFRPRQHVAEPGAGSRHPVRGGGTGPAWRPCRDRRWSSRCVPLRWSVRWMPP